MFVTGQVSKDNTQYRVLITLLHIAPYKIFDKSQIQFRIEDKN
jgi:hypothetical protein